MIKPLLSRSIAATAVWCCLAATPFAATVSYPEITFQVPVKLGKYNGKWASVWCEVQDSANVALAASFTDVPVTSGTYDGPANVKVQYTQAVAGSIAAWRCVVTAPYAPAYSTGGTAGGRFPAIPATQVFGEVKGRF